MASVEMKVTSNAEQVKSELKSEKDIALEQIGLIAERYAKELCPVDTGRLRNSISHARDGDEVVIGTNVEYAPYVELGTRRMSPRPFLKPAAENHASEYSNIVMNALKGS